MICRLNCIYCNLNEAYRVDFAVPVRDMHTHSSMLTLSFKGNKGVRWIGLVHITSQITITK